MKGRRLYSFLNFLSKTERRQLLHKCKTSGDKRHACLHVLLNSIPAEEKQLEGVLSFILSDQLHEKLPQEKDKTIRRFIDFCIKELEDLKLLNYLRDHGKSRMELLMRISQEGSQAKLFSFYLSKTQKLAEKEKDLTLQSACMDFAIDLAGRQQREKNRKLVSSLLEKKKDLLEIDNYQQVSHFYRLLSNLHLDDVHLLEELGGLESILEQLEALIQESKSTYYTAELIITQARFSFFKREAFLKYMERATEFIRTNDFVVSDLKALKRRMDFLAMVVGFHQGKNLDDLCRLGENILEKNLSLGFRDSISFFYLGMFYLLNDKKLAYQELIKKNQDFFIAKETLFYTDFLNGLHCVLEGKYVDASEIFSKLSYAPNYYISIWSKLFELIVHYKLGNESLCKSFRDRIKQTLLKNSSKMFTQNANRFIQKKMARALSGRKLKIADLSDQSPLHILMSSLIAEKKDRK